MNTGMDRWMDYKWMDDDWMDEHWDGWVMYA